MFLNVSGKNQSSRNLFGDYRMVIPNEVVSEYVFPDVKFAPDTQFKKIKKIEEQISKNPRAKYFNLNLIPVSEDKIKFEAVGKNSHFKGHYFKKEKIISIDEEFNVEL